MPHDIINLLSSPERSPVAHKVSEKPSIVTTSTRPTKAINYCNSKQANVDFFILSSDDEVPGTKATSNPVKKASALLNSKPLSGPSNVAKRPFESKIAHDSGVYFHSDDFDTSVDLDTSTNEPKLISGGLLGLNRKQMEEERLRRAKQRKEADLAGMQGASSSSTTSNTASKPPYIQSPNAKFNTLSAAKLQLRDNFIKPGPNICKFSNTSWNAMDDDDDPFASSPPTKKRRLSFSSVASPPRATIPKAFGYKRSISNIESSRRPSAAKTMAPAITKRFSKTSKAPEEADPIIFTSSPDHVGDMKRNKSKRRGAFSEDEDDVFEDDFMRGKNTALQDESHVSSDESLPDLNAIPDKIISKKSAPSSKRPKTAIDKYEAEKATEKKVTEKAKKEAERRSAKEVKEAERERKRLEKEEKVKEKQLAAELAEVNKLKTDKNLSAKEMIVDLPDSLDPKLASQIHTFFKAQGRMIEYQEYNNQQQIVKWRRRVVAEFDEDLGYRVNVEAHIKDEAHVMYIMSAKEFVDLATSGEDAELDLHFFQLRSRYESCKPIYLIQGLDGWKRKNKTTQERHYKDAVRSYQDFPTGSQRPKKKEAEYVDEELVEDALAKLQILGAKVHHTDSMVETAEWVLAFTLQISTIPYKLEQSAHDTGFCMENGQIKGGDGAKDTFIKMLEQHLRITAPIAWGIVAEYPTVQELVKGFKKYGVHALKDCRICANKDGAFTDRSVGKKISERLYAIFTDTDPKSWDV